MAIFGLGGGSPLGQCGGPGGGNPMQQMLQMVLQLLMGIMSGGMMGNLLGGGGSPFFPGQNPGFGGGGPGGIGGGCGCGGGGGPSALNNFLGGPAGRGGPGGFGPGGAVNPNTGAGLGPAGQTGNRLADYAQQWDGRNFKPGQTKRCADFVSTMLQQSGTAPPGFRHTARAADFANYGQQVGRNNLQPGDVVLFGNTYRQGRYTHVGIYLGDGRFVHRPTANRPVRIDSLSQGYYANKFTEGRRLQ